MKKYILFLFLGLGFISCNDFLETPPPTQVDTDRAVTDMKTAQLAINGLYDLMQHQSYIGQLHTIYGDVRGDDIQAATMDRSLSNFYIYDVTTPGRSDSNIGLIWLRPLSLIRNASNIIAAIDNGKVTDGTEEDINHIKGHAQALRAMAHFDLLKIYAYPYAKSNGNTLGVPIIDHVLSYAEMPQCSTVAESFKFIIEELKEAIGLMNYDERFFYQMDKYAARGLLARAYLYSHDYQNAWSEATSLIVDAEASGRYSLFTNANYMDGFAEGNYFGSEGMMVLVNTPTDNAGRESVGYIYHYGGYAAAVATKEFADLMSQDQQDVQYNMLDFNYPSLNKIDYVWLMKYPGESRTAASMSNSIPMIRLSEIYLIAAEAGVETGQAGGLNYLNAIVQRGNPANTVTAAKYTKERVLLERRKELVGEGHRYHDLMRNGMKVIRERPASDYHFQNIPYEMSMDEYNSILGIPLDIFQIDPNFEQNPVYRKN